VAYLQEHVFIVRHEFSKQMRWFTGDIPHGGRDRGRLPSSIIRIVLDESVGLPFRPAETGQSRSHLALRYLDEGNRLAEHGSELRCQVPVSQSFRPCDVIRLVLMSILRQCGYRGCGDVAHIHELTAASPTGAKKRPSAAIEERNPSRPCM
jgi:hypothetical protein